MVDTPMTANIPEEHLPGITAARTAYNATLPSMIPDPESTPEAPLPDIVNPDLIDSDDEYFELRAQGMVASWADQYGYTADAVIEATEEYLMSLPEEHRQEVFDALVSTIDAPAADIEAMRRRVFHIPDDEEVTSADRLQSANSRSRR